MACSNCNTQNCGCSGTYTVSQTCPPACSEVFNTACVVYTGVDITCPDNTTGITSTVVSRNDYLDTALTKIINYFCGRFNSLVIPTTVVESNDPGIIVTEQILGSVTTYLLSLDPAELPSASQVTAGDNVVVTGDGSGGDPYVVNSHESIVDVTPGTALSVSTSSTGPYENTYTIDIDASLLPVTELNTSFAHISIVETPNSPNAGDTTYTLEVDEVTITSVDAKIDVVNTAAGGIAPFERTFTVDINEAEMSDFIMDTAGANIIGNGGIIVTYDAIDHEITISETIGLPNIWFTLGNAGVDADISAASNTDTFNITADAVTDGLSVGLAAGPGVNEATFTIVNEDRGADQLIYGTIAVLGEADILAATNADTLTFVAGANIGLTTDALAQSLTIVNEIDHVYSDVIADNLLSLQAGSTTSTLEIVGGLGITTFGTAGPTNSISIENGGVLSLASTDANLTVSAPTGAITITNAAPNVDQFIWLNIDGDSGTTAANTTTDTLTVTGGYGITTNVTGDVLTVTADVAKAILSSQAAPGAGASFNFTHGLNTEDVQITIRESAAGGAGYYAGVDYSIIYTSATVVQITDIGGGLGAGTLRVSAIG